MEKQGVVGSIFIYIILIIIGAVIILIVLEVFTPYKFTSLFTTFISKAVSGSVI